MLKTRKILEQMGEQIKSARLRRKLPLNLMTERASLSRQTVISIEKGSSSVSIGAYAAVLHALNGMDTDFLLVVKDDELGVKLQDFDLQAIKRALMDGDECLNDNKGSVSIEVNSKVLKKI